ncbi:MAG: RNA polymerase sigma factor [Solirubrobacteraceae bacterium]
MASEAAVLSGLRRRPERTTVLSARRERALVRAAQRGDAAAVEALFRAHWPACHRSATLITRDAAAAEDIAQEAFLAALAALDRFDRTRPLGPWLKRIVANRAIDLVRVRAARREVDVAALEEPAAADAVAFSDDVLDAVAALPEEQRTPIVLRHLLELTPSEIAELSGVPVGTVNSRLRRGLDALQVVLEEAR